MHIIKRAAARLLRLRLHQTRYDYLLHSFNLYQPRTMIEVGVWRGDRAIQFLSLARNLTWYAGFDLFEEMDSETFASEKMGACHPQSFEHVKQRLDTASNGNCRIDLVQGSTHSTLPAFALKHAGTFDFIYLDGGHSLETIANDWNCSKQLMSDKGRVVFDDYYLNDTTRGAKPLIDDLLSDKAYRVRFFPVVEDIIDGLQITMVTVSRASENRNYSGQREKSASR